jgi:hypothetical protein
MQQATMRGFRYRHLPNDDFGDRRMAARFPPRYTSRTMTIEQLKTAYHDQPFRPFVMHLADGRQVPVQSREFIMAVPSGRTVIVCQPDDTVNIIDLFLVTDLEFPARTNGTRRKR